MLLVAIPVVAERVISDQCTSVHDLSDTQPGTVLTWFSRRPACTLTTHPTLICSVLYVHFIVWHVQDGCSRCAVVWRVGLNAQALQLFKQEVDLQRKLSFHPNIVRFIGACCQIPRHLMLNPPIDQAGPQTLQVHPATLHLGAVLPYGRKTLPDLCT